ncbi:MAG: choice-of-anchor J domain-containing protein, partial [Muribaculaceae bacterium]|nr:choice-of-anchor J domain-containing protein [Muribaculaceae bacterium]
MKKIFTLIAGTLAALGLWAQSATYEPHSHGNTPEFAIKAKPAVSSTEATRKITLRPHGNTAMQSNLSLRSAAGPLKAPDDINLIGFVSDNNQANPSMGAMYKIPYRASQSFERVGMTSVMNQWGGVEASGTYYTVYQFQISATMAYNYLYKYNTATWTTTGYKILNDYSLFASAQACDPTDGSVYGSYMKSEGNGYEFGIADFEAGTHATICGLERPWSACAVSDDGTLYAIDSDGDLYTVDKASGEMEMIAPTGITSKYLGGGIYDSRSSRILWSVCNDLSSGLYSVNPATGETALVTEFANNEEVLGMFIGAPVAVDDAPEQPANLTLDFPDGSLSGSVSFTVPTTTFGGAEATGEVKWSLTMNGMPAGSGTAEYGQHVDTPVTAFTNGSTTFIVTLSNDAGTSPQAKATAFIGKGMPAIPLVKLEYDEATETATLSWDPITKAVNEGYLNPDDITYTVTRYPDYKTVAEHTTQCTVTDDLPVPANITTYTYAVVAENGDVVSGTGNSVPLRLGSYTTPYVEDFTQMGNMADFTILDNNDDGTTWTYGMGGATIYGMQNFAMDDWLITPGINLKGGHKYYIELIFRTLQMQPPYADVEVKWGNGPTVGDLSTTLIQSTDISKLSASPFSTIITADADGKHYIGIHATTDESNWVQVQKIVIKDATMPGPVTDLKVTPGPDDALDAIVEFKAPLNDAAGDPLSEIDRIDVIRGGMFVKSFDKPRPGDPLDFEDAVYSPGNYQWVITAYNSNGAGLEASIIEYVGLSVPAIPQNVKAVEDGNTGIVTLSWDPVTTGTHGRPMSPQFIQHRILNSGTFIDMNPDVADCTYTARIAPEGEQAFAQMGVQVYNYLGSNVAYAPVMPVGKPYTEYKESFTGGQPGHSTAITDTYLYSLWQIHADAAMTGPGSADADGGYAMMFCEYVGGSSTLLLGKYDLSACKDPQLGVSIYNLGNDTDYNRNTLEVLIDTGNGFEVAGTLVADAGDALNTWVRRKLDLSDYADAGNIVIGLRGTIVNFQYLPIDKITIGSTYRHNLSAT